LETRVSVLIHHTSFEWLAFGVASRVGLDARSQWIAAYLPRGFTDASHHAAYALWFDVIGIRLESIRDGVTTLAAYIAGSAVDSGTSFNVPSAVPDLSLLPDCPHCTGDRRHKITFDSPEANVSLWKKLRGVEVKITMGPPE